jgi:hypothetical protein
MKFIHDGIEQRKRAYPFINAEDLSNGVQFAVQYLDQVIDHIKDNRPAGVCLVCQGLSTNCHECLGCGMLPKLTYDAIVHQRETAAEAESIANEESARE